MFWFEYYSDHTTTYSALKTNETSAPDLARLPISFGLGLQSSRVHSPAGYVVQD